MEHREERIVPFSQAQLYHVISDVDRYKEFLPHCVDSRVITRLSPSLMEADLTIGFGRFCETYRSRVTLREPSFVQAEAINSPLFKELKSVWRISPVHLKGSSLPHSRVEFDIVFEMTNPLYAHAMKAIFPEMASKQLQAFVNRCNALYRRGQPAVSTVMS